MLQRRLSTCQTRQNFSRQKSYQNLPGVLAERSRVEPSINMPLFKAWDISRTTRKAVVASSLEELIKKGEFQAALSYIERVHQRVALLKT